MPIVQRGETTRNNGHTHQFELDENANGTTNPEDDHVHSIRAGVLKLANGHKHEIVVEQGREPEREREAPPARRPAEAGAVPPGAEPV